MLTVQDRLEQIRQQARERGIDPDARRRPTTMRPQSARQSEQSAIQEPTRGLASRMMRPMPLGWRRQGIDRERKHLLQRIELRLSVRMIVRYLGDEWTFNPTTDKGGGETIQHTPSGAKISILRSYQDEDRYRIHAQKTYERRFKSLITVNSRRPPASIAADIKCRLINKGAIEQANKLKEVNRDSRKTQIRVRLALLSFLRSLKSYGSPSTGHTGREGISSQFFPRGTKSMDAEARVDAASPYGSEIKISIQTIDDDLIKKIGRTIVEHFSN